MMSDRPEKKDWGQGNSEQTRESIEKEKARNQPPNASTVEPDTFGGSEDRYSFMGPHGEYDEPGDPDDYGPQDQFSDVDGQDPYNNLRDEEPGESAGGEGLYDLDESLYGLSEPLAKPGDLSMQGDNKDRYGTRGTQNEYGPGKQ